MLLWAIVIRQVYLGHIEREATSKLSKQKWKFATESRHYHGSLGKVNQSYRQKIWLLCWDNELWTVVRL